MNRSFSPSNSFEIENSKGFFEKLLAEYDDFDKEHLNPRFAINAAITSWHLSDWSYQEFFKEDSRFQDSREDGKNIYGLIKYQNFLKLDCPELEYMRTITNGSKHCKLNQNDRTKVSLGDFNPYDFNRHDFNVPRFVLVNDTTNEELDYEDMLLKTIGFWRNFLEELYNERFQ